MLRSHLNPTASHSEPLVEAEGYNFLSATAVPGLLRLRLLLVARCGSAGVGGLGPISRRAPDLGLPRAALRWAEPTGEPLRLETSSGAAFGTAGLRAPRCLSGGLVQLASM